MIELESLVVDKDISLLMLVYGTVVSICEETMFLVMSSLLVMMKDADMK